MGLALNDRNCIPTKFGEKEEGRGEKKKEKKLKEKKKAFVSLKINVYR